MNSKRGSLFYSNYPSHLSKEQRNLGFRICRDRLVNCQQPPSLLYRRGGGDDVNSMNDVFSANYYRNLCFLDGDVFLAADSEGCIDIFRLPRYDSSNDSSDDSQPRRTTDGRRNRATLLSEKLGEPMPHSYPPPYVALKGLKNGTSFACGMPSGELRVYGTEERACSKWSSAVRERGPSRRYYRAWQQYPSWKKCNVANDFPLHRMIQTPSSRSFKNSNMMEIENWSSATCSERMRRPSTSEEIMDRGTEGTSDAAWDFLETGSLLAAHIDNEKDCFSLRLIDHRSSQGVRKSTVCVDRDSKDVGYHDIVEHVNSICFVGDFHLLTGHVVTSKHTRGKHRNVLKWWDRRMIHTESPLSTKEAQIVPSFPLDTVRGVNSCRERHLDYSAQDSAFFILEDADKNDHFFHSHVISRLTSSENGSTVSVSIKEECSPNHIIQTEILMEPTQCNIFHSARFKKEKTDYHSHPLSAISPNHDFMACAATDANTQTYNSVLLFDLSKQVMDNCHQENYSRKRSIDQITAKDLGENPIVGRLPMRLIDRFGIPSDVSCLAMNRLGNAIVCASGDGDLFVWRGA